MSIPGEKNHVDLVALFHHFEVIVGILMGNG